jgi:putative ABC transport system permease protein
MIWNDICFAVRVLRRNLLFAGAAIASLALAIGANTAVFSMVNAVLMRQMPFRDPESLVWIWSTRTDRDQAFFCLPDLADFVEQNRTLTELAAFSPWGANFTGITPAERFAGVRVSANVFRMLGVHAAVGRVLEPADDSPTSPRVLVLSHGLWERRFGGDGNIVGQKFSLSGDPYTVVGVLSSDFIFPGEKAEVFTALIPGTDAQRGNRDSHFLRVFARAKPHVTREQVYEDMAAITSRLRESYPVSNAKNTPPRVVMLGDEIVGGYKTGLWMALAAVTLVLVIACFNLASLLLSKSAARQREMTIRLALGAGRLRIARQMWVESLLLAVIGGSAGVGLAMLGVRTLIAFAPTDLPRVNEIGLDERVLLFSLVSTVLAGLVFGLAPAIHVSRVGLNARGSTQAGSRVRRFLVVGEVALSLILLGTAGLLIRGFGRLQGVDPGFSMPGLAVVSLSPPGDAKGFSEKVLTSIREIPGVRRAAMASLLPLGGGNNRSDFFIAGREPESPSDYPAAQVRWVSPEYFQTMEIAIRGREFVDLDGPHSRPVVVVDDSLARKFFPSTDALGSHIVLDEGNGESKPREIVGVAAAVKHFSLDEEPLNTIYLPLYQTWPSFIPKRTTTIRLVVRANRNPMKTADTIRTELARIANDVPTSVPRTLEQDWSATLASRRFNRTLIAVFAGAALLLAVSGLYALISYSVVCRTREIGVRAALGARRSSIITLVLQEGLGLVLVGVAIGLAGTLLIGRLIAKMLYETSPIDPVVLLAASILLVLAAILAILVPAWRATRIDPLTALRAE